MDPSVFPTKGNLIAGKNTLKLSKQGYDLLDKKRNVLMREIMNLTKQAREIQDRIDSTFEHAYYSLQRANMEMGISQVEQIGHGIPRDDTIRIRNRSIMGVEIPIVDRTGDERVLPYYGFGDTTAALDEAIKEFKKVKDLILELSVLENAAYRLAINIHKTQIRTNALKNVTIPKYEELVRSIQETLDERERDDFTRLKVVKLKRKKK